MGNPSPRPTPSDTFHGVVAEVSRGSKNHHRERLLRHAHQNRSRLRKTIRDLPALSPAKRASGIVISAGPSLHRRSSIRRIHDSGYTGTVIAVDASFAACLREGLFPDYVLTLDPHPTRMVRWFGDPEWEKNAASDDYFQRQDLDVEFRNDASRRNRETLELVNSQGHRTRAIVASTAPPNVVQRIEEAEMEMYWWNPLVDDPRGEVSLTRQLFEINRAPCLNTGGNVGTASWVFAATTLKLPAIALAGMDMGYYPDTPYEKTQLYHEYVSHLDDPEAIDECFHWVRFPLDGERYYTDPTYYWYGRNFLELLEKTSSRTYNCTEAGTLVGDRLECVSLDTFLERHG